jgi:hypothetical protein
MTERKLKIISADERMRQDKGVKALIVGPAGVGKTSLLRTLDPNTTLFIDLEAGDLAVQDVRVDSLRPRTWEECQHIAAYISGPNPALPPTACYSQAHYDSVVESMGAPDELDKYGTIFIDSITVAGRLCFKWAEQQPESFTKEGKKDTRNTYGLMGREMISWLTQLQHARDKNVIFVGILQKQIDDFNRVSWELQIEGSKTGNELPGIVDQVITMQHVDFDGQLYRAFVCQQPNPHSYPAKDRSGRLEMYEEPHLGKLLAKLTSNGERKKLTHTIPNETKAA